jgi:hypothetical protein
VLLSPRVGRVLSALGAAIVVVALFLKWYEVVRVGQAVTSSSGFHTFTRLRWVILLGAALTFASAFFDRLRWVLLARTVLGVVLAVLIARRIISPPSVTGGVVNAQVGVYIGVVGAVAVALGGLVDSGRRIIAGVPLYGIAGGSPARALPPGEEEIVDAEVIEDVPPPRRPRSIR